MEPEEVLLEACRYILGMPVMDRLPSNARSNRFTELAIHHKVLPTLSWGGFFRVIAKSSEERQFLHRNAEIVNSNVQEIVRIAESAKAKGLNTTFYKGPLQAHIIYGDVLARQYGDIDVLVKETDIAAMGELLTSLGYQHVLGADNIVSNNTRGHKRLPFQIYRDSWKGHELYEYVRTVAEGRYSVVELHRYFHRFIGRRDIRPFLDNARTVAFLNTTVNTLDSEFLVIQLLLTCRINEISLSSGGPVLKDYLDLAYFIARHKNSLDWRGIVAYLASVGLIEEFSSVVGDLASLRFVDLSFAACLLAAAHKPGLFPMNKNIDSQNFDWDVPLTKRLFLDWPAYRRALIAKYKIHSYGRDNRNFDRAQFVSERPTLNTVSNARDDLVVSYGLRCVGDSVTLIFHTADTMNLKNFVFVFRLIDQGADSNVLYSHIFRMLYRDGVLVCTDMSGLSYPVRLVKDGQKVVIETDLPMEPFDGRRAYDVVIEERIFDNINLIVASEVWSNDPAVHPPMFVVVGGKGR